MISNDFIVLHPFLVITRTVGEENQFKGEMQRLICKAYVPGRQRHFPVGPLPSQQSRPPLLPETTSGGANKPHANTVKVCASKLKRPVKLNPENAVPRDFVHHRAGGSGSSSGSSSGSGRHSKARHLWPRIFRGVWGHGVGRPTGKSASSSSHGPKGSTPGQKQTRADRPSVALPGPSTHRSVEPRGFRKSQTHQIGEASSVHKLGKSWQSFGSTLSNDGEATWQTESLSDTGRFQPRFLPPLTGKQNAVLDPADKNDVHPSTQGRTIHWSQRLTPQAPPHVFSPVFSPGSGALWKSELAQSNEKDPMSRLISFGNKPGTLTTPKLDNRAAFISKVSEPAVRRPNEEPTELKAAKWYLFNSYKTSGKRELAGVSGARHWKHQRSPFCQRFCRS